MKDILISNCEKNHVIKSINDYTRVDGRAYDEYRDLKIDFGRDWGCCHVSIGNTRVLAQASCEIQQPKSSRPHEGILNINVELSPMGAPNFEPGKASELSVYLNRQLEKTIKDSRAVDLESLCIKLNEKVWALRVDINILNHAGNLLDCASIAAMTALAHFKRPDVTSEGENIIIHTYEQRDPIATAIHHFPVCISYAVFNQGTVPLADPTLLEEGVAEGQLVFAVNAYKEICNVHLGGSTLANPDLILKCASKASSRAFTVVKDIKEALENDQENRKSDKAVFFENLVNKNQDLSLSREQLSLCLNKWSVKENRKRKKEREVEDTSKMETENTVQVVSLGEGTAGLLNTNDETENNEFEDSSDENSSDEVQVVEPKLPPVEQIEIADSDGSEEETTVTLKSEMEMDAPKTPNKNDKKRKKKVK